MNSASSCAGRLVASEIHWLVSGYIGVSEGFLGNFSYRTHREFYSAYCDLEIDPDKYSGKTTREKFISVLKASDAATQSAILRGIAIRFPAESEPHRSRAGFLQLAALIKKCSADLSVEQADPKITSEIVRRALADAALLIERSGPTSAVDRVHTALHAFLKTACLRHSIPIVDDSKLLPLLKGLQKHHPALRESDHNETMTRMLNSLGNIIETLNPARNHGSLAHANESLLDSADATLAINSARAVIQYLDAKLHSAQE
jgi:Abortive infection C-terminus